MWPQNKNCVRGQTSSRLHKSSTCWSQISVSLVRPISVVCVVMYKVTRVTSLCVFILIEHIFICFLKTVVEALKNCLAGSLVLAPVQISMVTHSVWTPPGAAGPVVVRVTWCCRMECVWTGRSVAANTTTVPPLV